MKNLGVIGLVAAVGGYLIGRRHEELRARVESMFRPAEELGASTADSEERRRPSYDTEYDHVAESEAAARHRLVEEIKTNPLRERESATAEEEVDVVATQPLKREREDVVAPRPI